MDRIDSLSVHITGRSIKTLIQFIDSSTAFLTKVMPIAYYGIDSIFRMMYAGIITITAICDYTNSKCERIPCSCYDA